MLAAWPCYGCAFDGGTVYLEIRTCGSPYQHLESPRLSDLDVMMYWILPTELM